MNTATGYASAANVSYAGIPAPDIKRQSELSEQADRLHQSIEVLANTLAQLGERISPVIRPIPTAVGAKGETAQALSPLGDQIAAATRRIDEMAGKVRNVLDALAL